MLDIIDSILNTLSFTLHKEYHVYCNGLDCFTCESQEEAESLSKEYNELYTDDHYTVEEVYTERLY